MLSYTGGSSLVHMTCPRLRSEPEACAHFSVPSRPLWPVGGASASGCTRACLDTHCVGWGGLPRRGTHGWREEAGPPVLDSAALSPCTAVSRGRPQGRTGT